MIDHHAKIIEEGVFEELRAASGIVTGFAVLLDGNLVLVVETRARDVISRNLFVQTADGQLLEVPRATETEQFLTPRSRR